MRNINNINNNIAQIVFPRDVEIRKVKKKKKRKGNGAKKKAIAELKEVLKSFDLAIDAARRGNVNLPKELGHLPDNIQDINSVKEIQALTESIRNRIAKIQQLIAEHSGTSSMHNLFGEGMPIQPQAIPLPVASGTFAAPVSEQIALQRAQSRLRELTPPTTGQPAVTPPQSRSQASQALDRIESEVAAAVSSDNSEMTMSELVTNDARSPVRFPASPLSQALSKKILERFLVNGDFNTDVESAMRVFGVEDDTIKSLKEGNSIAEQRNTVEFLLRVGPAMPSPSPSPSLSNRRPLSPSQVPSSFFTETVPSIDEETTSRATSAVSPFNERELERHEVGHRQPVVRGISTYHHENLTPEMVEVVNEMKRYASGDGSFNQAFQNRLREAGVDEQLIARITQQPNATSKRALIGQFLEEYLYDTNEARPAILRNKTRGTPENPQLVIARTYKEYTDAIDYIQDEGETAMWTVQPPQTRPMAQENFFDEQDNFFDPEPANQRADLSPYP